MDKNNKNLNANRTSNKKTLTLRIVLNIYGVFAFTGLLLTIFTHPITEGVNEFLLFILVSSIVYFSLLNLYYLGGKWEKVVFVSLFLIGISSIVMAVITQIYY